MNYVNSMLCELFRWKIMLLSIIGVDYCIILDIRDLKK